MSRGRLRSTAGQTMAEYAIVIAAIAVACSLGILFVSGAVSGRFDSTSKPIKSAPFHPPSPPPELTFPTSLAQCEHGGWRDFPQFTSETECVDYINGMTP